MFLKVWFPCSTNSNMFSVPSKCDSSSWRIIINVISLQKYKLVKKPHSLLCMFFLLLVGCVKVTCIVCTHHTVYLSVLYYRAELLFLTGGPSPNRHGPKFGPGWVKMMCLMGGSGRVGFDAVLEVTVFFCFCFFFCLGYTPANEDLAWGRCPG